MKNMKIIGTALALIILIGGAAFAYNKLAPTIGNQQLMTQEQEENAPTKSVESSESSEAAENRGEGTAPEPQPMPDFTVYDEEGKAYALSDFKGKPVILNFWATWCGYCKVEMPAFQEKYDTYGEDIHFLMINMTDGNRETVEGASSYISKEGYRFPVYYDENLEVAMTYQVTGLPMSFFVDADGYYVAHAQGALDAETLQTGIDMLLE